MNLAEEGSSGSDPEPRAVQQPTNRVLSWLFARTELADARAKMQELGSARQEFLHRAQLGLEMGELALAPGSVVRSGTTAGIAANLFRQSVYWALLAQRSDELLPSPQEAWASADPQLLALVSSNPVELAQVGSLLGSTFIEFAGSAAEMQAAAAEQLCRIARILCRRAQAPVRQLEWAKLKRLTRVTVLGVLAVVALLAVAMSVLRKPDLAAGKPWHTSSVAMVCHPEKSDCGGAATDILFHTKLELNPWFEYDFGAPLAFSSLTIKNRSDFGPERAVPLIVEVSNDDHHFQQIARRDEVFSTWRPSFPTQHARYLRLRVPRESMLHLEAIRVHP